MKTVAYWLYTHWLSGVSMHDLNFAGSNTAAEEQSFLPDSGDKDDDWCWEHLKETRSRSGP